MHVVQNLAGIKYKIRNQSICRYFCYWYSDFFEPHERSDGLTCDQGYVWRDVCHSWWIT